MSGVLQIGFSILLLLGNAFFVGAEFALVSVRRSQVQPLAEAGDRRARTVVYALEHVSAMMAAAQLGITVCSLLLGALAEPVIAHLLEGPFHTLGVPDGLTHPLAYVIALAVVVFLHMVVGEMVPKNIALAGPERAALWLGPPLAGLARLLRPVIRFLNAFANLLLRLLGVEAKDEVESVFTSEQLAHLLQDSREAGLLGRTAQERLEDALELGRRPVSEVLMEPDRVVTVDSGVTARHLEELAVRTGFSRFPVVGGGAAGGGAVDDGAAGGGAVDGGAAFLGYLHVKDALELEDREAPVPRELWRPLITLSDRTPLDDALAAMRRATSHLAGVVGRDGTPLGLVTMEDVLEELVGEVRV
ncbi:hemolysin family protein [Streptacidiphilus carbonis]|uniref:hemolysin family protein n=1 Tax=Streptacidiphilus carbonis TaxID=105422 RepID=UPI0005AB284D|nr:hemolysin family protein [Streptacidiphilus carbonis]